MKRRPLSFEARILWLALGAGVPGSALSLALLWSGDFTPKTQWTFSLLVVSLWLGLAFSLRDRVVFSLQTLSNLLAALREGDFSVRGRAARADDALGEVMREVNTLSGTLREQRLGAMEASTLLRIVMREIDVAVFAFDGERKLRLLNRAAERLLARPAEHLLGSSAAELGLAACLSEEPPAAFHAAFPGGEGLWGVRRTLAREHGAPLQLLVLSDLTRALREQELQAWQKLVRVLGHELNNSLTPVKSIAGSLASMLAREPLPGDWRDDMRRGLSVIDSRSESLIRFVGAYARLAKLPRPHFQPLDLGACVERAARLETRLPVNLVPGPALTLRGDPDQIEQVLINLLRNAADASLGSRGSVSITWSRAARQVEIRVTDEGPGLAATANLFVPFFTTKPGGSGIGLVLSRQIAEAHNGSLTLENRAGARGCVATLRLPLSPSTVVQ